MSARPRITAKLRRAVRQPAPAVDPENLSRLNGRVVLLSVGVAVAAFAVGYAMTALAFTTGGASADIVIVPDVRGLPAADAARRMADAGLTLAVGDSLANPGMPAGAVLAQSPLHGQEVSPNTEVRVILSTGQHRPMVPEVEAMPLTLATRALQAAGFDVLVEDAPGEGQPGRVVSVQPMAGTAVLLPATVVIRIGARRTHLEMPAVLGMQEDMAREILEEVGLRIVETQYESSEAVAPYHVVWQSPEPGDSIAVGAAVRLRVTLPTVIRGPRQ